MKLLTPFFASFAVTFQLFSGLRELGMAITAWSIAYLTIPLLIRVLRRKQLLDIPDERASHDKPTPTLGGISIFIGLLSTMLVWLFPSIGLKTIGLGAGGILLFLTGIVDDLLDIPALKKLVAQIIAAMIVAFVGIRFYSLYGFFGIYDLPLIAQYIITIIVIVGVTNAFNLLDGINGLAGGIGLISFFFLGLALKLNGDQELPVIAFTVIGAILAFLHYNFRKKAAIFMGDTGSLILGFLLVVLGIEVFNLAKTPTLLSASQLINPQTLAFAALFLPVIDALRVFASRLAKGNSPFDPDKTHIHHVLLDLNCSHIQASMILWATHLSIISVGHFLSFWPEVAVVVLLIIGVLLPKIMMSVCTIFRINKRVPRKSSAIG